MPLQPMPISSILSTFGWIYFYSAE